MIGFKSQGNSTSAMSSIPQIELIADVESPGDLKPIIRWHHERYDGTGYPDRLRGDEIPLSSQVVGIADVYDALTTARPYRLAFSRAAALAQIATCRGFWSDAVYGAFVTSVDQLSEGERPLRSGGRLTLDPIASRWRQTLRS